MVDVAGVERLKNKLNNCWKLFFKGQLNKKNFIDHYEREGSEMSKGVNIFFFSFTLPGLLGVL